MAIAVSPATAIATFVCPECGVLATPTSRHEIVAAYCMRHETGTGAVRLVRMELMGAMES